ncbi:unnamed protein product [Mytilus coruscus]|uniref:MEGF10_11 n=1 Tax=Mytilus coruscus TaxID=42192 RepID=A0A6J8DKX4_MYTCO|nr:unnamed protein product [Mytilus coruscus]
MAKQYICLVLLFVFISIAGSKKCVLRTESGVIQQVCCADYEANKNDCVACSKGYTSMIGQHCMPCPKNTYGERCRYECSCARSEMCDNVEGCIEYATTTDTSVHARSSCSTGYTSEKGQNCTSCPKNTYGERCKYDCFCSGFEICDNVKGCIGFPLTTDKSVYATPYIMTLPWDINVITNGEKSDNSIEERSVPDNRRDSPCEHEYRRQKINELKKDALRLQYEYDIALINGRFTVPKRCLSNITKRVSQSCNNLKIECIKSNMFTGNNGKTINSTDNNMLDFHNMSKARSESNIV